MTTADDRTRLQAFIRTHTRPRPVPVVPEISLYQTDDITGLWEAATAAFSTTGRHDLPPPYWACAWPGGQAVARFVLDRPDTVHGRRVLVFGAGGGVDAIAAAVGGARRVIAWDTDPLARVALLVNAALNGVDVAVGQGDLLERKPEPGDIVLAGDIFYEQALAGRALVWLHAAKHAGAQVLLGDPGRTYRPADGITPVFEIDIPVSTAVEGQRLCHTTVYELA